MILHATAGQAQWRVSVAFLAVTSFPPARTPGSAINPATFLPILPGCADATEGAVVPTSHPDPGAEAPPTPERKGIHHVQPRHDRPSRPRQRSGPHWSGRRDPVAHGRCRACRQLLVDPWPDLTRRTFPDVTSAGLRRGVLRGAPFRLDLTQVKAGQGPCYTVSSSGLSEGG